MTIAMTIAMIMNNNNERSPLEEKLTADIAGRVLQLCGPRDVARTWAALSRSSLLLRDMMREARLDVRELNVQGTRVTDAWLRGVATTFTGLASLDLGCREGITDAGLEHVGKLSNLATLDLRHDKFTDAGLAHLARLPGLTSLNLHKCRRITDAGLAHVAKLSNLTTLDLSFCTGITDAGLAHLRDLLPWCEVRRC